MHYGFCHLFHQGGHDFITRQLHIQHGTTAVDALHGEFGTPLVGISLEFVDMLDERTLKGTVQYLVFMSYKGIHAFVLQFSDDAGTHIDHLFIRVFQLLVPNATKNLLLVLLVKES